MNEGEKIRLQAKIKTEQKKQKPVTKKNTQKLFNRIKVLK